MSDDLSTLGGMLNPPEQTPGVVPASFDTGIVTEVVDATHVKVNLGDKTVTTYVPASHANTLAVDTAVRVSLQENTYTLDSIISGATGGPVPVGAIMMWMTATAPTGWLKCDGSTYSSATYPALFAVLGTTTLPNMSDRFPIGVSGTKAVTTTGGASSVAMTEAQMPSHNHSISHTHNISHTHDIGHSHTMNGWIFNGAGASGVHYGVEFQSNTGQAFNMESNSQTSDWLIDAGGGTSGAASTSTSGAASTSTSGTSGSGSAMTVLNPYLALNFIIKAQ